MEESLSVITLEAIGVLESEPISSFLLFFQEDKPKTLGETFLKAEEVKTLLERWFAIQQVWGLLLEYTCFLALEPALEK